MATEEQATSSSSLKQKLQEHLAKAQEKLASAKQEIAGLAEQDKQAIRRKAEEIRSRMKSDKEEAERRRKGMSEWLESRKQHTDDQIASWRQKREIKHLQKRADRAEEYAVNIVFTAMVDADEAEAAVLEALEARLDADSAAS